MAACKPLVLGADGLPQQLQSADTTGINAVFSGTATTPVLAVLGSQDITVTVAPAVSGDALVAGEHVSVTMPSNLPAGLAISGVRAASATTVVIRLIAVVAVTTGTSVTWSVTAHR